MKFFVMKNLAVFGVDKRTWSSLNCTSSGSGIKPPGYEDIWSVATNGLVGGVSLHFQEVTGNRSVLGRILPAGFFFLFFECLAVDTEGGNWAGFQAWIGNLLFAAFTDAIDVLVHAS
jgi:hypothetical protein